MSDETIILQRDLNSAREELTSLRQELRTQLHTVLGFAQLLKSSPFGDSEPIEQIYTAATRLAELIEEKSTTKKDKSESNPSPEGEVKPMRQPERTHTVLCIEDNLANCQLIEGILIQRSDIKLIFAMNGREGLALAREHRPDLVLLDLNLPDMHGSEVLQSLHDEKRTENLPVVVISADATASQIEKLLSGGALNYLTKPIDIERFLYTVDEILVGDARVE